MSIRTISKLTTQYLPAEDRIRISARRSDDVVVVLWLTRRLADRLIPNLIGWIEKSAPPQDQGLVKQFKLQSAQVAARQETQQRKEAPVTVQDAPKSETWLIHRIDVNATPEELTLILKDDKDEAVALKLAQKPLRQWLSILFTAYQAADWSGEFWPEWITDIAAPPKRAATPVH